MGRKKEIQYYNDRYRGTLSDEECHILDTIYSVDVVPDLRNCIYELPQESIDKIIRYVETNLGYPINVEKPLGTLSDMQTVGVAYMYWAGSCILGDSVGLGKTVQVAGLINLLKTEYRKAGKDFNVLFLTEKVLIDETRTSLIKFTSDYWYKLRGDKDANLRWKKDHPDGIDSHVIAPHSLIKQAVFLSWLEECETFPFQMLVVDESSVLGNSTSEISQTSKLLMPKFERKIFLNATPFETKLDVFYNQLDLIDPTLLPTKQNFTKEYVVMDYTGMFPRPSGKYKNAEKFKQLVGYRYFARTRKEEGAVMKDCEAKIILSSLNAKQNELLGKTHLNQMVYDYPTYFDAEFEFTEENVPKLKDLNSLLMNECKDSDSIIVFTLYKEYQEALVEWFKSKGYSCRKMNGDTNEEDRAEIIKGFKEKDFHVLVTNVQKGLNFGSCDYCIFYSFNPNPSKMIQMEGRITRSFDVIGKHVYLLCSRGKEYSVLNNRIRNRAKASADFATVDVSCIMSLLLGDENVMQN
jgi:SNF2 family DNA or RNA helicase